MLLRRTPRSPLGPLQAIVASPSLFSALDLGIETKARAPVRPAARCGRPGGVAAGAEFRGNRDSHWPFATEHSRGPTVR
jgi:hypothetical protein